MIFVGDDWAEDFHDVEVQHADGRIVARRRLAEGVDGLAQLHALLGEVVEDPAQVVVGIETERGPWVAALVAAGYQVFAINPLSVARYRERHSVSGAKSDTADAHLLAELVRLDRQHHRPIAADSELAEAVKILARAHQTLIWQRLRQAAQLRSALRQYYPGALEAFPGEQLHEPQALAILARAPSPAQGRALSTRQIEAMLRRAGRQRRLAPRACEIRDALRAPQLAAAPRIAEAFAASAAASVALLSELQRQIARLEAELAEAFRQHPDAEILDSLPGLGLVLGARALGEFGDAPNRYQDGKARRNYAGTSPITRQSGTRRAVQARYARNKRLADTTFLWAFASLRASAGARAYYDQLRGRGHTHNQALRQLANRLVGILHGCLRHRAHYDETVAWTAVEAIAP
jgi:transposase